jgi:hypothetical protein
MPVAWRLNGPVVTLSVSGVVTNEEIEAGLRAAIAATPDSSGLRLLWDARASQTPVSSDDMAWRFDLVSSLADRGILSRIAVLFLDQQGLVCELARVQMQRALPGLPCEVFSEPAAALAWLET